MVLKCLIIKVFEIANITISTQTAKEKRLISTKKFVSVPKCAYICILSIYIYDFCLLIIVTSDSLYL